MICEQCGQEAVFDAEGWTHKKMPSYGHPLVPISGTAIAQASEALRFGSFYDVGEDVGKSNGGTFDFTDCAPELIQRVAKIGLDIARRRDPGEHCGCSDCAERCAICKKKGK